MTTPDRPKWEPTPEQVAKVRALLRPHLAQLAAVRPVTPLRQRRSA